MRIQPRSPSSASAPVAPASVAPEAVALTSIASAPIAFASAWGWALRAVLVAVALSVLTIPAGMGVARSARWNATPVALHGVEVVLQSGAVNCGPALIATLATWAGDPVGEAAVLARAEIGPNGISLAEFARLASYFEVPGVWYRVDHDDLNLLATPFVAQLEVGARSHFVAVLGVRHGYAVVADPAVGALSGSVAAVLPGFSGRVFLLGAGA